MEQSNLDDDGLHAVGNLDGVQYSEFPHESSPITAAAMDNNSDKHVPAVGMSFPSDKDLKSFYRQYACRTGFSMRTRNTKKGADGKIKYLILTCSREGKDVSKIPAALKANPITKINCPAKITALLHEDGLWYIHKVILDHCHDVSPMLYANRTIRMHMNSTIQMNDEAGDRLIHDVGGFKNASFVERDIRNFVKRERRMLGKEGDGKVLLGYFARMQQQNNNFFYEIDLDDEFNLRCVFWADARTRAAYESFGDIIFFDTTYLTNKYDLPFAPFVGVNHHGQSILLGCSLLSSEDTDSFVWLFDSWLRCMSGKAPAGIVTTQCKAMQNAIKVVFPNARHRWCLWHIMKKLPEKLCRLDEYEKIKHELNEAIYDSLSEAEFEAKWGTFVENFRLHNNEWLSGLYEERSKWVPIFLKKHFWAGMSTTRRSESVNAFFDGYINSKTSLAQFVRQYDNVLHDKAEKEYQADFRSFNSTIPCESNLLIERQFQKEYTHAKFNEVQAEFIGKINCCVLNKYEEGSLVTYQIMEEEILVSDRRREAMYVVVFNRDNVDVECNCLLFEFKGIMCRHTLIVLHYERIKEVPPKYILSRWSKLIRRRHTYVRSSYDVIQLQPQIRRFDKLCKEFFEVAKEAAENEEATEILANTIRASKDRIRALVASKNKQEL